MTSNREPSSEPSFNVQLCLVRIAQMRRLGGFCFSRDMKNRPLPRPSVLLLQDGVFVPSSGLPLRSGIQCNPFPHPR
jgi:hypothetical protein